MRSASSLRNEVTDLSLESYVQSHFIKSTQLSSDDIMFQFRLSVTLFVETNHIVGVTILLV